MSTLGVTVAGATGRMGRTLIEAVLASADVRLKAALERKGHAQLGANAGQLVGAQSDVTITDDVEKGLAGCDLIIDFTRPEATLAHVAACRKLGVRMVIGTTGFNEQQKSLINEAARDIAIAMAPNFSVGVNVAFKLLEVAAGALRQGYDVEIIEAHHRHKVDAPSGTALRMGEVVAHTLGRDLGRCAVFGREGITGERKDETIGFATVRGGDLVGDHTVMFIGAGERLEVSHRASSRANYAQGALRAARFLMSQRSGFFDMHDVLGFR
jgi:4-hydroxy-tetrahydrodipicolinate reductase